MQPTVARVAMDAEYIVVGTIIDSSTTTDTKLTLDVSGILKKSVGTDSLTVNRIRSNACGDGAPGIVGDTMIFARHLTFFGATLDAYWIFDTGGALIDSSVFRRKSDPPATVQSVEAAIRGQLPNTDLASVSAAPVATPDMRVLVFTLGVAIWAALALGRRRRPR